VENAFGILSQSFRFIRRRSNLPEHANNIIFSTCILYNYLIDQGVGLSDMGSAVKCSKQSYRNTKPNRKCLQKCCKVRDNLKKNSLIVRLDLCLGRMKGAMSG
jgi:hypothetical protein